MSGKEIAEELEKLAPKVDASFVINDLEYLTAGGRVSALKAGAAALLNIKPSIMVRDGKMVIGRKYHGKFRMVVKKYVNDVLENSTDINPKFVFITHSGVDADLLEETYQQLKEKNIFENIFISRAGCTISSHCGPDTLGVLFIRKQDIVLQ
jgi:DegV family protein with EDD domain